MTPEGLRAVENDTLNWYSPELYANFNTGVLEEYLEERNRRDSFVNCPWQWKPILMGIIIGTIFAFITEYVGLKVGIAVAGGSYVVYAIGLAFKWKPTVNNNAGGAATAATQIGTGFIFTYPAIWLLHLSEDYVRRFDNGVAVFWIPTVPPMAPVILATTLAGILGTVYFILFRRIWLVNDPLPTPGFEVSVQLMDIANEVYRGTAFSARRLIVLVFGTTGAAAGFTFLKDGEFFGEGGHHAVFDVIAQTVGLGEVYGAGSIHPPSSAYHYTVPELGLSTLLFGIGWFMRARVAILVSLGSFLMWFIIVPLAVASHTPVFDPRTSQFYDVNDAQAVFGAPAGLIAFQRIGRYIAIGAILGGGLLALLKMYPVFVPAIRDVVSAMKGGSRTDYIPGKGWYEWPLSHIGVMIGLVVVLIPVVFIVAGFPVISSILLGVLLFGTTFALGAIAVKVLGETGQEPVSGTTFLFLIIFMAMLMAAGRPSEEIALFGLLGATVFGCAISMSGTIITDYKAGIYVGNRPYHLMRSTLTGVLPGTPVAAVAATMFSILMVTPGGPQFLAPQANAFAGFTSTVLGESSASALLVQYIALGFFIGIMAEYLTGMGTAFGLGMYFYLVLTTPTLIGGLMRDWYEIRFLEPRAKAEDWTEKQYIIRVLDTFMIAAGLIIGEAVIGVFITIIYLMG